MLATEWEKEKTPQCLCSCHSHRAHILSKRHRAVTLLEYSGPRTPLKKLSKNPQQFSLPKSLWCQSCFMLKFFNSLLFAVAAVTGVTFPRGSSSDVNFQIWCCLIFLDLVWLSYLVNSTDAANNKPVLLSKLRLFFSHTVPHTQSLSALCSTLNYWCPSVTLLT